MHIYVTVFNSPATWAATFHLQGLTQCVLCLCVTKQWYGCQCLEFFCMHKAVKAYGCAWGLHGYWKRICTERWLRGKKLAVPGSWDFVSRAGPNNAQPRELHPHPSISSCNARTAWLQVLLLEKCSIVCICFNLNSLYHLLGQGGVEGGGQKENKNILTWWWCTFYEVLGVDNLMLGFFHPFER